MGPDGSTLCCIPQHDVEVIEKSACHSCCSCPWRNVPPGVGAELAEVRRLRRYVRKQEIFGQGDSNDGLYRLRSGVVALSVVDVMGNLISVGVLTSGDIFGYRSLIGNEPHAVTATAYSPTEICHVPRRTAMALVEGNAEIRRMLSQRLAKDVRRANECYLRATSLPVRERLIQFLFSLGKTTAVHEEDGRVRVPVPLKRADIAAVIGIVPETMSRTTRRLEQEGYLVFDKGQVTFAGSSWEEAEMYEQEFACTI